MGPRSRANSHNRDLGGGDIGLWTLPRTRQRHAGVTEGILRPAADRTSAPEAHPDLELEGPGNWASAAPKLGWQELQRQPPLGAIEICRLLGGPCRNPNGFSWRKIQGIQMNPCLPSLEWEMLAHCTQMGF